MNQLFQDSMAICRAFGKPDLFLTMTANPKWPEIQEALLMYKTKSHVASLLFEEPQLASIVRANEEVQHLTPTDTQHANQSSPFMQSFFAGTA